MKFLIQWTKLQRFLICDILSALHKANVCIYDDSMQPLVYKDIQKALKEIQKL